MDILDVDALLVPFSDENPCGEDLEYDLGFGAMERAAQRSQEQQFGDTIIEAKPPEWREVKSKALELFKRTKDLRVAAYLAKSVLHTDGLIAFQSSLSLIERLIANYWDTVYPLLDPDDDNDPTLRVNTLLSLCDEDDTLPAVRSAFLVRSRAVGQFCLRDIQLAQGDIPLPENSETEVPNLGTIDAAFMDVDLEELKAVAEAATKSVESMNSIEHMLLENVGSANAVDLSALTAELKQIQNILQDRLARRGVSEPGAGESEAFDPSDSEPSAETNGSAAAPRKLDISDLQIYSREDVIRTLDKICDYYRRHEPSSPLPLLLERAKRLVPLGFMELLRDLAPGGLEQAEALRGGHSPSDESDSDY